MKYTLAITDILGQIRAERMRMLAICAAILIGMLFALLSVYAFWNPAQNMEKLEVPVVILDEGATIDDEYRNFGQDIEEKLQENDKVSWKIFHENVLDEGIEHTDYFFGFIIPEDFSQTIADARSTHGARAHIIFTGNARRNFLMSQMSGNVRNAFSEVIAVSISENYAQAVYDGLESAANGFAEAADGSRELQEGMEQAENGAEALRSGAGRLAAGSSDLTEGLETLDKGAKTLRSGSEDLSEGASSLKKKTSELSSGLSTLSSGARDLASGTDTMKTGADTLAKSAEALSAGILAAETSSGEAMDSFSAGLSAYTSGYKTLYEAFAASGALATLPETQQQAMYALYLQSDALNQGFSELSGGIGDGFSQLAVASGKLSSGADALQEGAGDLQTGAGALSKGLASASGGASKIAAGAGSLSRAASRLQSGTGTLKAGTGTALSGSRKVSSGSRDLSEGADALASGQRQLLEGGRSLTDGLNEGRAEIAGAIGEDSESMAAFIADPLETDSDIYGETDHYGLGLAPMFLSLGLWIGSLILFFAIPLRPRRRTATGRLPALAGSYSVFLGHDLIIAAAIGLGAILLVGIAPKSIAMFFLWAVVCGTTFLSILYMLHVALGELPAKAVGILFIVFQIATSGGAIAPELEPGWLQAISHFFPMRYSIDGFREILFGGEFGNLTADLLPLLLWTCVSLALSLVLWNRKARAAAGQVA